MATYLDDLLATATERVGVVRRAGGSDRLRAAAEEAVVGRPPHRLVDALSGTQGATAGDGRHLFFEWREGMSNSAAGLPPGLDVRGEGGFVVAPGAVNGTGVYRLIKGSLKARIFKKDQVPFEIESGTDLSDLN